MAQNTKPEPWMFVTNPSQWTTPVVPANGAKIWSKDWSAMVPVPNKKTPTPIVVTKTVEPQPQEQRTPSLPKEKESLEELATKLANTFLASSSPEAWTSKLESEDGLSPKKKKQQPQLQLQLQEQEQEDDDDKKNGIEDELSKQNLYKTELCRSFAETGICRYGHRCQFAHGEHELRPVLRHPKYKTETCKSFYLTGNCRYGSRCRFIHAYPPAQDWANSWDLAKVITTEELLEPNAKQAEEDIAAASKRLAIFEALAAKAQGLNSS